MDRIVKHKLDDKQTQIAISLYRHLFWADNLRKQFENILARDREELKRRLQAKEIVFDPKLLESEMYLSLWLGCLYSVIEGWSNLKIEEPRIKQLLEKGYKKKLFGFRNAVFHPVNYDDARFHALATEGQKSLDWAREITNEFKTFFESILVFPSNEQSSEG
ncbi:MAG TPA: hypothetical protein VK909_19425 [Anaerolineales bacterium]|nr:hypothetical protein [Anaerolineales bacterium]